LGTLFGDGGELSTTIEAYWALKLAGLPASDKAMAMARQFILERVVEPRSSSRRFTAFGAIRGRNSDAAALVISCCWFPLNIYEMSSWARYRLCRFSSYTIASLSIIRASTPMPLHERPEHRTLN
jgi:squalene-hopene/tetraprenyl-beta-curcumene cyclase